MSDGQFIKFYDEFSRLLAGGDEVGLRQFLVDNFRDFPEEIQTHIVLSFFEEGLNKTAEDNALVGEFRKDTRDLFTGMEQLKRMLEDKKRLLELQEKIQ